MAFDQSTRNRLQKFVNDARNLLTEEFTRQLQATYGLDPKAGSVASVDSLTHLDNRQRQTANILRDTLAHYLATTHGKGEKDRNKQALSRIVREQAFTVLNRLAALRMAEARGFLLETIAKGYNAKGFQLYKQLAGSALGETGEAYRNYLYSVFDEFSLDLAVLFDRHSAQGRLFPRESALLELLDLINHHEIEPLWAEDETIGWIYQYFNSQEERKKMRAESQAPRNSRELAVRNQFFTPRYVVEFLTDNTLGRIWYEMTQGNTCLVDSCRYLVRRPTEVFLKPGEQVPEQDESTEKAEALSQEELLKQPVYITHRAIKDPRCIRMLDPACGSMHFGLYAFDLYERIYEEAWRLEAELGVEAFVREGDLKPLQQTYDSFEDYRAEIPRLIIEHNIHGVDIDPRAVQIAGLSLWQRAQRAWQQQAIKPQHRPVVRKSNIVCAEPMPGEKVLLQEFASSLNPPVLGQLLEAVFDKMELAGEAGTLLKIEEEIQSSIHEARDQWQVRSGSKSVGDMFQAELDQATPQKELRFDLSGVDDESFWDGAEQLILDALSNYADKAESNADQKRLFAEDAAKGFAFIDLCRKRFDVVLMNPPFGAETARTALLIEESWPEGRHDLATAFVMQALARLSDKGSVGVLMTRTPYFLTRFAEWRNAVLEQNSQALSLFADLGQGVLDSAMVEAVAAVFSSTSAQLEAFDCRSLPKDDIMPDVFCRDRMHLLDLSLLRDVPNRPLAYFAPKSTLEKFRDLGTYGRVGEVKQGLQTKDNDRFARTWWEVPAIELKCNKRWRPYAKGGEYARYYLPLPLVVDWSESGQRAYKMRSGQMVVLLTGKREDYLNRPGITFSKRSQLGFSARTLPSGAIFSANGPGVFSGADGLLYFDLAFLNSKFSRACLEFLTSFGSYSEGYVKSLPYALPNKPAMQRVDIKSRQCVLLVRSFHLRREENREFVGTKFTSETTLRSLYELAIRNRKKLLQEIQDCSEEIESSIQSALHLSQQDVAFAEAIAYDPQALLEEGAEEPFDALIVPKEISSFLVGAAFGRWDIRYATGECQPPELSDPFDPLPVCSPGMLQNADGLLAAKEDVSDNYPLPISWSGILVDDEAHPEDIVARVRESIEVIWKDRAEAIEQEACDILGVKTLRDYFRRPAAFFADHLKRYSKSRRQAPIYWPLSTKSGSYTLWLYYHRLTPQILYTCVNDLVQPKLEEIEQDLNTLRGKSPRSTQEEKELESLSDLASELRDFRDELLRLAKFWKPNLNDGVQVTAAPLWKLFQHKAWQKKLKETWEKLEKGDYDWAHLACSIWPERVLRKCHQDRSLAIAHDVEVTFWHEVEVPVKRGKKATGETKLVWQPKELSDAELDALIQAKIKEMNA